MKLCIQKGLDIPIKGGSEKILSPLHPPSYLALNLEPFHSISFRLLVKVDDVVKIGQPLLENKSVPGQFFVSPAAGVVSDIQRGLKRRLLNIVIKRAEEESVYNHPSLSIPSASREAILAALMQGGIFPHIRKRPFDLIANPQEKPRNIFVKALETLPFIPSAESQIDGFESYFQGGLDALAKLTTGKVHLVYREGSLCNAFQNARHVEKHTISGPHPAANSSVHIHLISPIQHTHEVVWTLNVVDVIAVGKMLMTGTYFTDRLLSVAGEGILPSERGFVKGRSGVPLHSLIEGKMIDAPVRILSGDPLTGVVSEKGDFLGFYHTTTSVIPENTKQESFHFFRFGGKKFTATKTYLSGHLSPPKAGYTFTTNQHGEERPFIDGKVYEKVMPLRIPTMHLIKALLAEDYELADVLGFLEVAAEDFALPAFICPSKIEMVEIVHEALLRRVREE